MSAVISDCGRYRYLLRRDIGDNARIVTFVMLNPSTADATRDDATIRKICRYARDWGYGEIRVVNLFAFRATNPMDLAQLPIDEAVGPENNRYIQEAFAVSGTFVCAWGDGKSKGSQVAKMVAERRQGVRDMLNGFVLHRLGTLTKAGNPRHPLYLPSELVPRPMP